MDSCRDQYPVRMMCRCLKVSPSGYYAWRSREPSARARANDVLLERIRIIHYESDGVRGSPKITERLNREGYRCSQNRVARLMSRNSLRGVPQRRRWVKKGAEERPAGVSNHLNRDFTAHRPDEKWVSDITYIRTGEGWLFLCIVLDLATDLVVGWSMATRQDRELVIRAVMAAVGQRQGAGPTYLHSDRGTQYTSDDYQAFLADHGLVSSMSAVGSCADNAPAEGFFGRLKRERIYRRRYQTHQEARTDVFEYIEVQHNAERRAQLGASILIKPSVETG